MLSFWWTDEQFVDFILTATSSFTIDKGKDSTSLEEVISVQVDKQQTEKQSGEDESESFEETLSVGLGNVSSFEITGTFKRRQDLVYFTWGSTRLIGRLVNFLGQWKVILCEGVPRLRRYACVELHVKTNNKIELKVSLLRHHSIGFQQTHYKHICKCKIEAFQGWKKKLTYLRNEAFIWTREHNLLRNIKVSKEQHIH